MNASAPSPMWVVSSVPCQVAMPVNRHRHTATTTPHRHHALMHHSLTLIHGNRSHPSLRRTSLSLCLSACTRATTSFGYGRVGRVGAGRSGAVGIGDRPGITRVTTSSGYGRTVDSPWSHGIRPVHFAHMSASPCPVTMQPCTDMRQIGLPPGIRRTGHLVEPA